MSEQTSRSPEPAGERRLFGTDGVRGVANVHPMTAEMALQLGRAIAYVVRSGPHRHERELSDRRLPAQLDGLPSRRG